MLRRLLKGQDGLSLIELLVVLAIMGVLATLTAVAVTGTTSTSKGVAKTVDEKAILDGDRSYSGEHDQGRHATLDGCFPGLKLDTVDLVCKADAGGAAQEFTINEADLNVDVNKNDVTTDTAVKVVPILWNQFFGSGDSAKSFLDVVNLPKHGFELVNGTSWKSNTIARTEDGVTITAPNLGLSTGDPSSCLGGTATACPAWVFNEFGDAVVLIADSKY